MHHKCSYLNPTVCQQKLAHCAHLTFFMAQLKHVKREVELSRQRSLRLKAQVDRLQQQNDSGPGWSENRQRVSLSLVMPQLKMFFLDCDLIYATRACLNCIFNVFVLFLGGRGSWVCCKAAAPSDRLRVSRSWSAIPDQPFRQGTASAAECGPETRC